MLQRAAQVTELIAKIDGDLKADKPGSKLNDAARRSTISDLKEASRNPTLARSMSNSQNLETLCNVVISKDYRESKYESLALIGNVITLIPESKVNFDYDTLVKLGNDFANDMSLGVEGLYARLFFILSTEKTLDMEKLTGETRMYDAINRAIEKHAASTSDGQSTASTGDAGLTFVLRSLFGILSRAPKLGTQFDPSIGPLFQLLTQRRIPSPALGEPMGQIIGALCFVEHTSKEWNEHAHDVISKEQSNSKTTVPQRLCQLLEQSFKDYQPDQYEANIAALLKLTFFVLEGAPDQDKVFFKANLLPSDAERDEVIGQSNSLASQLIRQTSQPMASGMGGFSSSILFSLSDSDPEKLVQNIGFGYASGILYNMKIPFPTTGNQGAEDASGQAINPVTGQRLDKENTSNDLKDMTDEEKEREAEKLFVLFQRLEAGGYIQPEMNPIRQAVDSGRFEELPDDADTEEVEQSTTSKGKGRAS